MKQYTAQEMREAADNFWVGGVICVVKDEDGHVVKHIKHDEVVAMLRQAADALEHEKEREYSIQVFCGKWEFLKHIPTDMTLDDAITFVYDIRQHSDMTYRIVRREVDEWEEVPNEEG